jgi:SPP1 gp7 family putative phage head morphogenesis protein
MSDILSDKILRNVIFLEARAKGIHEDLIKELSEVFRKLTDELSEYEEIRSKKHLKRLLAELEGTLQEVYGQWGDTLSEEVKQAVEIAIDRENKVFVKEFEVDELDFYQLPLEKLEKIIAKPIAGGMLAEWVDRFSSEQTTVIRKVLFSSITEGIGGEEAARRLRKEGVLGLNRHQADVIGRTAILQASAEAREDMMQEYEKYIPAYRYVATLDSRTCLICAPTDGKTSKRRGDLPNVPRHPRCRCTITPWNKKFIDDDDTRPSVIHSQRTVNHRDGSKSTKFKVRDVKQVKINTTYVQWFETLSKTNQRNILGQTRFELYQSGKFQIKEYATPNRIKSIKELQRKIDEE